MGIFRNMLGGSESLFLNELALDYTFVPKLIPYRESQQHYIASRIKPLLENRNGRNTIIHGPPGVGKTVACMHVLKELEEETDEVIPIYINCWQKNTTYKVVLEICSILGYKFTQNKRTEELFEVIKNILNKKSAVFVFDEIDKAEEFDFIYTILEEIFRKSIFLITNYKTFIDEIDNRIKSRLVPETLEFKPYNETETNGILKERAGYAFAPNVLEQKALDMISKKTFEIGDIRIGLYLLREAGLSAEDSASKTIEEKHAKKAINKLSDFSIKKKDELDEESNDILKIVKDNSGRKIGELYKIYQEKGGKMAYKSFQRKIAKLAENKFIASERVTGGSEGNTTIIKYGADKRLTEF